MKKLLSFISLILLAFSGLRAQTYTQTTIVSGLDSPVAFDIAPDGRFFITLKGGWSYPGSNAKIVVYSAAGNLIGTFYDLTDSVDADFERGLLGITLAPDFATSHYVYAYYVYTDDPVNGNGDERIRIERFTEVNSVGTNPTIMFDLDVADNIPGNHVGGNVHFRPSDPTHLYFTIGDLALNLSNPTLNYANKLTNPFGKVLRIGLGGVPAGYDVHGLNTMGCEVPTDNPFYDDGDPMTNNCDIIWSYGHRNPFDFTFSTVNDSLYISENGQNSWDEMNLGRRGGFFGWANCEGFYNNASTTVLCTTPDIDPLMTWAAPLPAVTGIVFYSSTVMPNFDNHVLVADNDYGQVWDITMGNGPAWDTALSKTMWMDLTTSGGLTTLKQGADGCIYAMKGGYTTSGAIYRVCPTGMGTPEFANNKFYIKQNVPNPFNSSTTITYKLQSADNATIALYDVFGREVAILADGEQEAGEHTLTIDRNALGLSSGMYFCTMTSGGLSQSINIVVAD